MKTIEMKDIYRKSLQDHAFSWNLLYFSHLLMLLASYLESMARSMNVNSNFFLRVLYFNYYIYIFNLFWVNFFMWYEVKGPTLFLYMWISVVSATFVEIILPPLNGLVIVVENKLTTAVWLYFWISNFIALIYMLPYVSTTVLIMVAL